MQQFLFVLNFDVVGNRLLSAGAAWDWVQNVCKIAVPGEFLVSFF